MESTHPSVSNLSSATEETAAAHAVSERHHGPFWQSIPRLHSPRWHWGLISALALILALQLLLSQYTELAQKAQWRPWLERGCALFRCTLPVWHQPDAFFMLQREVRPVRGHTGILRAQAHFRNQAPWPQAWPALRFSLSDADGRLIGQRLVLPQDYLLDSTETPTPLLAADQSAHISFYVHEPEDLTVAFRFEFF